MTRLGCEDRWGRYWEENSTTGHRKGARAVSEAPDRWDHNRVKYGALSTAIIGKE